MGEGRAKRSPPGATAKAAVPLALALSGVIRARYFTAGGFRTKPVAYDHSQPATPLPVHHLTIKPRL